MSQSASFEWYFSKGLVTSETMPIDFHIAHAVCMKNTRVSQSVIQCDNTLKITYGFIIQVLLFYTTEDKL